mmetsp:Transcript_11668/g.16196  ORF Transcript_11668/g.16196 Transcript_11668/m.16196 type:complete len:344 (+) Transcript_11668:50-1081(+)
MEEEVESHIELINVTPDEPISTTTHVTVSQKILAASIGGTLSAIVVCPLDVVKARLQAQKDPKVCCSVTTTPFGTCTIHGPQMEVCYRFTSTTDAFLKIVKFEGVGSLWRGLRPTLMMSVPAAALYFTTYDALKEVMEQTTHLGVVEMAVLAGFGARSVTATVTAPLELIRTNLQATSSKTFNEGLLPFFKQLVRKQGFRSLWAGLPPTILRDAPFSAIYWSSYEIIKMKLLKIQQSRSTHSHSGHYDKHLSDRFFVDFISGACAGMIAASLTNPIDVVKTRRQISLQSTQRQKTMEIFSTIIKEEGLRGLTKGIVPRVAKVAPACAIMISSYELCKQYIRNS